MDSEQNTLQGEQVVIDQAAVQEAVSLTPEEWMNFYLLFEYPQDIGVIAIVDKDGNRFKVVDNQVLTSACEKMYLLVQKHNFVLASVEYDISVNSDGSINWHADYSYA